jgi:hypothetical protein
MSALTFLTHCRKSRQTILSKTYTIFLVYSLDLDSRGPRPFSA